MKRVDYYEKCMLDFIVWAEEKLKLDPSTLETMLLKSNIELYNEMMSVGKQQEENMGRGFARISIVQASKDGLGPEEVSAIEIPTRATMLSAGYDLRSVKDMIVPAHSSVKIPTGIRAFMLDDEVLLVHIRSSLGFKYNIRLSNATGVIDSDYYFAENEGHIWLGVFNDGNEDFIIKRGDRVAQGIFMKYETAGDVVSEVRTGGLGSTNKKV